MCDQTPQQEHGPLTPTASGFAPCQFAYMHGHELVRFWFWIQLCAFVAVASALVGVVTPVISGTGICNPTTTDVHSGQTVWH
jgi:hypothetical protein